MCKSKANLNIFIQPSSAHGTGIEGNRYGSCMENGRNGLIFQSAESDSGRFDRFHILRRVN